MKNGAICFARIVTAVTVVACSVAMADEVRCPIGASVLEQTAFWQSKIDATSASGGGRVTVPDGIHTVANLALKNDVELYLAPGCVLQGSTNRLDYGYDVKVKGSSRPMAVLVAVGATNIAVCGKGTVDGRGELYDRVLERGTGRYPKKMRSGWGCVRFFDCSRVRIEGVTLRNPVTWTCFLRRCEEVTLRGVTVRAHCNWNNDGIDLEVRRALVENCDIDAEDDALVFKTMDAGWETGDVEVRGCTLSSCASSLKFGTETKGGFRRYSIHGCRILARTPPGVAYGPRMDKRDLGRTKTPSGASGSGGIVVAMVDGGQLEDVNISDIEIGPGIEVPIFVRLGRRNPPKAYGETFLRNVTISDVRMTAPAASRVASSITGVPGLNVENVMLRNVSLISPGGGTDQEAKESVREAESSYPSAVGTFKIPLPAYGLFVRHAQGVSIENFSCRLMSPDARPERKVVED